MDEGMAMAEPKRLLSRPGTDLVAFGGEGTAGLETWGTTTGQIDGFFAGAVSGCAQNHRGIFFLRASVAQGVYLQPSFLWLP